MIKNIAICDSGIGGLFLLAKLVKLFPNFKYIYISDKENLPYGNKTKNQIIGYAKNIIEKAKKFNSDILIVACNTLSEIGERTFLKQANIPVFFVRHNIRKILASNMKKGRFFCTVATSKTKQIQTLSKLEKGFVVPLKNLAFEVENNALNLEKYCPNFLKKTHPKIQKVYLGCTHYALILNKFKKSFPNAKIYDASEEIISFLKVLLPFNSSKEAKCEKIFIGSGNVYALNAFRKIYCLK
ncbi:MAG: aspartate/glutamate racemase family protein [Clostridia bacterium]|nr:aspartate/glutamate racemase family protein [Clostridia bacterium]